MKRFQDIPHTFDAGHTHTLFLVIFIFTFRFSTDQLSMPPLSTISHTHPPTSVFFFPAPHYGSSVSIAAVPRLHFGASALTTAVLVHAFFQRPSESTPSFSPHVSRIHFTGKRYCIQRSPLVPHPLSLVGWIDQRFDELGQTRWSESRGDWFLWARML